MYSGHSANLKKTEKSNVSDTEYSIIEKISNLLDIPLNTGQDGRHVIGWTPAVLQNVETQLPCAIYIGMEHLTDELDTGRLVGILFLEMHDQTECAIFEGSISGADNDGIPDIQSVEWTEQPATTNRAYQVITLSATGDAETPAGGSVCMRCHDID